MEEVALLSQLSCCSFVLENPFPALAFSVYRAKIHELSLGFRKKIIIRRGEGWESSACSPHCVQAVAPHPPVPAVGTLPRFGGTLWGTVARLAVPGADALLSPSPDAQQCWCVGSAHRLTVEGTVAQRGAARKGDGRVGAAGSCWLWPEVLKGFLFSVVLLCNCLSANPSWCQNPLSTSPMQNGR